MSGIALTAADFGLVHGCTYTSRKRSRSPERTIIHISPSGEFIQYDGPAVKWGRQYPIVDAATFAKWAGLEPLSTQAGVKTQVRR